MNTLIALLACAGACATVTAQAAEGAQTYGVVSLIGEELNLVAYSLNMGTNINRNPSNTVTVAEAGFDAAALGTIERTVKQADPAAKVVLYRIKSARLTAKPSLFFTNGRASLPPAYAEAMKQDGVTRVLLLTRVRRPAIFQVKDGEASLGLGSGIIEGLGFYADGQTLLKNDMTNYVGKGYLAPFVSLHMDLIELASGQVLTSRSVFEHLTIAAGSAPEKGSENAWGIVPDAEKIPLLNRMITQSLERTVPLLLQGTGDGSAPPAP